MTTTHVDASSAGWRASAEQAARRLAAITAVGGVLGLLVGGVGGRLAMMLLARLNPEVKPYSQGWALRRWWVFPARGCLRWRLAGILPGATGRRGGGLPTVRCPARPG